MADEVKKFLDEDSLQAIKEELTGYVKKETGKGLSTNDYTKEDKDKLAGVAEGADVSTIKGITVNNTPLTPDASKNVNIDLTGYAGKDDVDNGYAKKVHTHSISDVDNLQVTLDQKLDKTSLSVLTKDEALAILRGTAG